MCAAPAGELPDQQGERAAARDAFNTDCPARRVLDDMASRWAVLVLRTLSGGPHRYTELRAVIDGISDKMLTATLQTLEGDGLVHREIGGERPPSVTYSATDLGRGAIGALQPFLDWIRANAEEITAHWPTSPFGAVADPRQGSPRER